MNPGLFAGRGPTLLDAQRWAGSAAALFAFVSCAVSGELGASLVVLFPLALVAAHLWGDRAYGKADWAWTVFLAGALVLFGTQVAAGRLDIVRAAAQFVELLCVHRVWHRHTQRDELLLLLLSLLLLCAGAALSAELTFGLAFVAFAVAATWALALTHLRFEIEAGRGPSGSAALLHSRRIATPALLGGLAVLAMLALAGAAVLFFAFPRVSLGGFRRAARSGPTAGLSDRVDLGRNGTVADDPRVVLRVRVEGAPAAGTLDMHWRAHALELWTGRGWRSLELGLTHGVSLRVPPLPAGRAAQTWTVDIEAVAGFSGGVLLTPGHRVRGVEFRRPLNARRTQPRLMQNQAGDLFYEPVDVGDLHYLVRADADPPADVLRGRGQQYPKSVLPDLHVPADLDPRVVALAQRLGGGKDPLDAALAIESFLAGNLGYTRDLAGEVADPVADFLFDRRKGHCELFSTAMVLMLRALGIPARNVTGYYGGRLTVAGYYAVRAGDAHSWVEVYFPGQGFVQFDPTPPAERGGRMDTLWSRAVLLWDMVEQRWRAFVVDYDLLAQVQALQRVGALVNEAQRTLSGKAGAAPRLKTGLLVLLAALAGGLLAWAARQGRLGGARGGRAARALDGDRRRALRLWRRARARLLRAGIELRAATTAQEAARLAQVPAAAELARAYLDARWGGAPLPAARVRQLLRKLDGELARRA